MPMNINLFSYTKHIKFNFLSHLLAPSIAKILEFRNAQCNIFKVPSNEHETHKIIVL